MRLCLTTPVLPAFFIALSALLAGCSSTPRASEEGNAATETSGQVAFDLTVKAPDDVQKYLERYVEHTGDLVPIYYLVEKFIKPRDGRQEAALAQLPALAEQLQAMLKQAGMA